MNEPVLILGAASDIAVATAHRFAAAGHPIQLAARTPDALADLRADIALRHDVAVSLHRFDALDSGGFDGFVAALPALPGTVVCAVGLLGDQAESQTDKAAATAILRSNFEGPALVLGLFAEHFAARGSGTIIGISSVAGERGRASNYVYGSAKAGFTAFLSGLRNRLSDGPVRVITILPGFVATKMTDGRDLPPRLTATPGEVATAIWRAATGRREIVYVRPVWRIIMAIIRALPEPIFKKTRF